MATAELQLSNYIEPLYNSAIVTTYVIALIYMFSFERLAYGFLIKTTEASLTTRRNILNYKQLMNMLQIL